MNKRIRSIAVASLISMMVPVASYAGCGIFGTLPCHSMKSDVLPIQTSPKQDKKPVPVVAPDNAFTPSAPMRDLNGSWTGELSEPWKTPANCTLRIEDRGLRIIGICDASSSENTVVKLDFQSESPDSLRAEGKVWRTYGTCSNFNDGKLTVLDKNTIKVSYDMWSGCNVPHFIKPYSRIWRRN